MNVLAALHGPAASPPLPPTRFSARRIACELFSRERRLAVFGTLLLALLVPMALAAGLDERVLRGANVWIKPMKFALSIALLAFTTAWFIGHLQPAARKRRAVSAIVWLLIATGTFELAYIALQAALGEGSHYNLGSTFHRVMYPLMGVGALLLTATQPMLAGQLTRHAEPSRPEVYRVAVRTGLWLAFVFGAGVGLLLSNLQPPDAGSALSLPLFGWSLQGGDLRPAHFIGLHAAQVLPLVGLWLARRSAGGELRSFLMIVVAYSALFAAAVAWGLNGRI